MPKDGLLRVLVVEDSQDDYDLLIDHLKSSGLNVVSRQVDTEDDMIKALDEATWDIIISDYSMPRFSALGALQVLRARSSEIPFIVVSGTIGEEVAVEVLRAGALDFFLKGKYSRLIPAIERELREAEVRKKLKESEEQFRQSQKMEAIGQLAGGVAHDFNNILALILLYCDLLKMSIGDNPRGQQELEQIRAAGERAAGLTRQLLAFSRKQVLNPKILEFDSIIRNIEKMLQRTVEKNINLVTSLNCQGDLVNIDPSQIDQVIINLVVNARDAMPDGGTLTIRTQSVEITDTEPGAPIASGSYILLEVSDTGHGMDSQTIKRIFEPFFTTKPENKGTGLGLSTVYGIVKQSQGYIFAESAVGVGTTFKIYLPKVVASSPAKDEALEGPVQARKDRLKLILVEDEDLLRDAIVRALELQGHQVMTPKTWEDVLEAVKAEGDNIDLVITDILMPGMSGIKLAHVIREISPKMKVLYISGYFGNSQENTDLNEVKDQFLKKPFSTLDLLAKISEIMKA